MILVDSGWSLQTKNWHVLLNRGRVLWCFSFHLFTGSDFLLMNASSWRKLKKKPLYLLSVPAVRRVGQCSPDDICDLQVSSHAFNTHSERHMLHYSGWICMQMEGASCPLSAGARVGFPHSWRLTPSLLCLVPAFNSSLPSGDRGYLSKPVASFLFVQLNQYPSADTVLFHKCQQVPLLLRSLHVNAVITGSKFCHTIKVKRRRRRKAITYDASIIPEHCEVHRYVNWLCLSKNWQRRMKERSRLFYSYLSV